MIKHIVCFLFVLFVLQKGMAQVKHLWIGSNLTEVYFAEDRGTWFYQSERTRQAVHIDDDGYHSKEWKNRRITLNFENLDVNLDTIKLNKGLTTHLFIKPHLVQHQKFNFYAIEYVLIDTWGSVSETYNVNKHGVFRKSDYKNNTLIERQIDTIQLENLMKIIRTVDVKNIDKASGRINNCDQMEHRFTFIDNFGNQKSYKAIHIRKQLDPIRHLMLNLGKTNKN